MIREGVYGQFSVGVDGIDEVKSMIYFICATEILLLWSLFTLFFFALIAQLCTVVFSTVFVCVLLCCHIYVDETK